MVLKTKITFNIYTRGGVRVLNVGTHDTDRGLLVLIYVDLWLEVF